MHTAAMFYQCCDSETTIMLYVYNANKSFCMVIDNKPRDKKNFHPVVINNHTLPYTEKYKYLDHIINNNLTDDDDFAMQKKMYLCTGKCFSQKM